MLLLFSNAKSQPDIICSRAVLKLHSGLMLSFIWISILALSLSLVLVKKASSSIQLDSQIYSEVPISAPLSTQLNVVKANSIVPVDTSKILQHEIDVWISAHQGVDWSVSVKQLDGNLKADFKPDDLFTLASIYKLYLLLPLNNVIPGNQWANSLVGKNNIQACVDAMLRVSDNECAESIGYKLGWSNVENNLHSRGYSKIDLSGELAMGTASETVNVLAELFKSNDIETSAKDTILQAMRAPKAVEGIRNGCQDCLVYNKTGDNAGYRHDSAIIQKNGKTYSLAIFSKTGSWPQIAELTSIIASHF